MEIIVGKTAGFCYGVKNAVDKSMELIKENEKMCCLGEIVHNKYVVDSLNKCGMTFIEKLEENENKYNTIVRAHGIKKELYKEAENLGIKLIDLTCPNVLKIHKIVENYNSQKYFTFLIGSKTHPETIGTASFYNNEGFVIGDVEDIEDGIKILEKSLLKKVLIVVQTTYSLQKFKNLCIEIKDKLEKINIIDVDKNLEIINTICNATKRRQEETEQISKEVDCMIIIGGKNSSNTKKLFEIAELNCKNAICIENVEEIIGKNFTVYNKIGIMAGASTPQISIDKIIEYISNKC